MKRHAQQMAFKSEQEYKDALIAGCLENEIEVIGITNPVVADDPQNNRAMTASVGTACGPNRELRVLDHISSLVQLLACGLGQMQRNRSVGTVGLYRNHHRVTFGEFRGSPSDTNRAQPSVLYSNSRFSNSASSRNNQFVYSSERPRFDFF